MEEYVNGLYKRVVQCVKASNSIPSEENDFHYHMKFPEFQELNQHTAQRLSHLLHRVLHQAHGISHVSSQDDDQMNLPEIPNIYSMLDTWLSSGNEQLYEETNYAITDVVDGLLESADRYVTGHLNPPIPTHTTSSSIPTVQDSKPQTTFKVPVDNSVDTPFHHVRRETDATVGLEGLTSEDQKEMLESNHPYYHDIMSIQYTPNQLTVPEDLANHVLSADRLETRPCTWIDTLDDLKKMRAILEKVNEIAVDLEHHSIRSYLGFTCLMQISTRDEDFLVDTIALRADIPAELHSIFINPKICKVFHGANMDIKWLQCDLRLYVINMFDTGQAARVLSYPGFSLAYLLSVHCQLSVDKQYQTADWRSRPLSDAMKAYARQDTCDLLYIYDRMRLELLKSKQDVNLLQSVLDRSSELCLQVYEKPNVPSFDMTRRLCQKLNSRAHTHRANRFSDHQMNVLHALNVWRDAIAREKDESVWYVMSNKVILQLVKQLPTTCTDLLRACGKVVPPLVDAYKKQLVELIKKRSTEKSPACVKQPNPPQPATHKRFFYPSLDSNTTIVNVDTKPMFQPWPINDTRMVQVQKAQQHIGVFITQHPAEKKMADKETFDRIREETRTIEWNTSVATTAPKPVVPPPEVSVLRQVREQETIEKQPLPPSIADTFSIPSNRPTKKSKVQTTADPSFRPFDYQSATLAPKPTTSTSAKAQEGYNPFIHAAGNTTTVDKKSKGQFQKRAFTKPRGSTFKK